MNIKTQVASRLDFSAREAPGILTVITREEILNSGARNLIDVLRLVPGLDFGVDVESTLGLGVRGNWAYEGKTLVLVDGQRYNESFMGTVQLVRLSPEQVEKIDHKIERLACGTDNMSCVGGMSSKIEAAKISTREGIPVILANGLKEDLKVDFSPIGNAVRHRIDGTLFLAGKK